MQFDWIPLAEKKPAYNSRVLIVERDGNIVICNYVKSSWTYNNWEFLDEQDEQPGICYPTHWMELPEPPIK